MDNGQNKSSSLLVSHLIVALVALVAGVAIGWLVFGGAGRQAADVSTAQGAPDSGSSAVAAVPALPLEGETPAAQNNLQDAQSGMALGVDGSSSDSSSIAADSVSAGQSGGDANAQQSAYPDAQTGAPAAASISENGTYTSKDDVALYIHTYGHLPSNYISKTKAKKAGWVASEGNLDDVLPGMSIGGSEFYNDEGQLPDAPGRTWTECDINYAGGYRGAERIVFSNDGLVFYTADHYDTFEQLY